MVAVQPSAHLLGWHCFQQDTAPRCSVSRAPARVLPSVGAKSCRDSGGRSTCIPPWHPLRSMLWSWRRIQVWNNWSPLPAKQTLPQARRDLLGVYQVADRIGKNLRKGKTQEKLEDISSSDLASTISCQFPRGERMIFLDEVKCPPRPTWLTGSNITWSPKGGTVPQRKSKWHRFLKVFNF